MRAVAPVLLTDPVGPSLRRYANSAALVETTLFSARPIPGFVMRPLEPRVNLKILLLRPRHAQASRVLADFTDHLGATFP